MSSHVLIIGATRGLGASLRDLYTSKHLTQQVFATTRSDEGPASQSGVSWVPGIDLTKPDVGQKLVSQLPASLKLSTVIINAGYFGFEDFDMPDWDKEVQMYTTSSIAPVFIVQQLVKSGFLVKGSKVILVSSESGSITLRHEKEGGGNYGHHASKAALNMVGKLLSLDLKPNGIAVGLVHPGFMRTEMTKSVGFDKYWDAGGGELYLVLFPVISLTYFQLLHPRKLPNHSLLSLTTSTSQRLGNTGRHGVLRTLPFPSRRDESRFANLRHDRDIGTAEPVLGTDLPTPLQLPW
jgi:NAD(P)-dependent dehydrogenase (short-subunit alcohol dehydrogenase family)